MQSKIEFNTLGLDELMFGLNMYYGEDANGTFHAIELGVFFFSVSFLKYL